MINSIKNSKQYLIYFGLFSFLFLWDLKFGLFQARFLVFLILLPLIFEIILDIKEKKFNYLIYILITSILIFLHLFSNLFFENKQIDLHLIFTFVLLIYITLISIYFHKVLSNSIDNIIKIFLIIFIISSLVGIILKMPDAPHFCGGIPDIFTFFTHSEHNPSRVEASYYKISFSEFIFLENSHLGMIAPGVICYLIHAISTEKKDLFYKSLTFLFLIVCLIKSSTTLIIGTVLSILILSIFNLNKLNLKTNIIFFLVVLSLTSIFLLSKECKYRLPIKKVENNLQKLENTNLQSEHNNTENYNKYINLIKNFDYKLNFRQSLSTSIVFNNLRITFFSLKEKPLGWGINRYYEAATYFNNKYPLSNSKVNLLTSDLKPWVKDYNQKDGSNNLFKLLTEFGVFSLIFFFYIFKYIVNNNIPMSNKLFFVPIILTQLIRGAGYFNGGFALILCIMIFQLINLKK